MQNSSPAPLLWLQNLGFSWPGQARELFFIPELKLSPAERLFLKGASGSGKTTLLNLVGGVLSPTRGEIQFLGRSFSQLSASAKDQLRADEMGFIFQLFNLLPFLTVEENILLSAQFSAERKSRATHSRSLKEEVRRLVEALGLNESDILERRADQLSVGQQQRVACARALLGRPKLLIADEPTSALDADTKEAFIQLLLSECEQSSTAVLFVSHDSSLAQHFDRKLEMADFLPDGSGGRA